MSGATRHWAGGQDCAARLVLENERLQELGPKGHEAWRADRVVKEDTAVFWVELDRGASR